MRRPYAAAMEILGDAVQLTPSQHSIVQLEAALDCALQKILDHRKELHALHKERDPKAIERRIAEAVSHATARIERELAESKRHNAELARECDELRASKRRLRDAIERMKGAR